MVRWVRGPRVSTWWPAAALVGLALAARFVHLGAESLTSDEAASLAFARLGPAGVLRLALVEPHPPTYYLLLSGWIPAFGESEVALRSLGAVLGALGAAFAYGLGLALADRRLGAILGCAAALASFAVYYGQEARMYSLLLSASLAACWATVRLSGDPSGKAVAWAVASWAAAAYAHMAGLFVVLACLGWLVLDRWMRGLPGLAVAVRSGGWFALVYLPWAVVVALQTLRLRREGFWIPEATPDRLSGYVVQLLGWDLTAAAVQLSLAAGGLGLALALTLHWLLAVPQPARGSAIALVAGTLLPRLAGLGGLRSSLPPPTERSLPVLRAAALSAALAAGVVALPLAAGRFVTPILVPRTMIALLIPLWLMAGVALWRLTGSGRPRGPGGRDSRRPVLAPAILPTLVVAALMFPGLAWMDATPQKEDWRGTAEALSAHEAPDGSLTAFVHPHFLGRALAYYAEEGWSVVPAEAAEPAAGADRFLVVSHLSPAEEAAVVARLGAGCAEDARTERTRVILHHFSGCA